MATATKSKSKLKLQPLGDRVVVERDDAETTTAGGIVLPDSAQDRPARGIIVSVGSNEPPLQVPPCESAGIMTWMSQVTNSADTHMGW